MNLTGDEQRSMRRVIGQLKALNNSISREKSSGPLSLRDKYNRLVERAQKVTGEEFTDYLASESVITTFGELAGVGRLAGVDEKLLDLRLFRPLIESFLFELEPYAELAPTSELTSNRGTQSVVNVVTGETVSISTAGRDSHQRVELKVRPGDRESLVSALANLGIPNDNLAELRKQLKAANDDEEATRHAALSWLAGFTSQIASEALGSSLAASLPAIAGAVTTFIT